ncbi:GntR family transcriptional regulator [Occultella gossypii]|uniref:GntR family transcriptional regulator n=1 Tax=Occultella gossypii TaxID=2800820 RepID=A0ABS7S804_9MICO|nr:GntR family transcriptional regulator [Occultella gossypii]MBZ2196487.1 GntR family transcriptional regulator [Occultella gossypii]
MAFDQMEPVNSRSTAELIAEQLRAAITSGALAPGQQLGEAELVRHFAVSRGPLREAMQRLVSEGILYSIRNRGTFVPELSLEDMIDVYRSRSIIERGAAELILDGRRDEAYTALEAPLVAMRAGAERTDAAAVSDADQAFHETLVRSAGSPRLMRALRTLLVETRMCLGALQTTYPDLSEQVREHVALREAVRSAPRKELLALLTEHLDDAVERLRLGHEPVAPKG